MEKLLYIVISVALMIIFATIFGYHQGKMTQQNEYYQAYNKMQAENLQLRHQKELFNIQLESAINGQKVIRDVQYKVIKQQIRPTLNSNRDISIESAVTILNNGIKP